MNAGFEPEHPVVKPKGLSFLASSVMLVSSAIVLSLVAVGATVSSTAASASESAYAAAQKEVARKADALDRAIKAADKAAKEKEIADAAAAAQLELDDYWAARKYYKQTDTLYWKWAPNSRFECAAANYSCVGVQFTTLAYCAKGFLLEATVYRNDKKIGTVTRTTRALTTGQTAVAVLDDKTGTADYSVLDNIECRD